MSDRVTASVPPAPGRPVVWWAGAALLVGCCTVAAASGPPGDLAVRPQTPAGTRLDVADLLERVPSWVSLLAASLGGTLLLVLVVPLLVVGLRALWRLLLELLASTRRPPRSPGHAARAGRPSSPAATAGVDGAAQTADRPGLRAALAAPAGQAADSLRQNGERDGTQEVIRCWEAVEQAAASSGAARRPGDTPAEFSRAVLQSLQVDDEPLQALLEVYGRARFSRRPLTAAEVDRAGVAFATVADQLGGARNRGPAGSPRPRGLAG